MNLASADSQTLLRNIKGLQSYPREPCQLMNPLIFVDRGIAAIRREFVDVPSGELERDHGNFGSSAGKIR